MACACSWRFSTSSWQFEPMTNGNLLVEVLGTGSNCSNLFSDSLLYEEFEKTPTKKIKRRLYNALS